VLKHFAQDVHSSTHRHCFSIDKVTIVNSWGLFLVNVFEIVAKENGVLFVVSLAQVEELLAGAVKIRHVFHFSKHLHVFSVGNHCDKTSSLFDREGIISDVPLRKQLTWRFQL